MSERMTRHLFGRIKPEVWMTGTPFRRRFSAWHGPKSLGRDLYRVQRLGRSGTVR
jgi:hypothetical protein